MKSLKDYSLNLSEKEYHAYPAWSHSLIARYARDGFAAIATIHDPVKTTAAMEFGSLFDSILTRGKETLDNYVVDSTVAPPAEKAVFDYILASGQTCSFDQLLVSGELEDAMNKCEFYQKYSMQKRIERLTNASAYYNVRRTGKNIVSQEDWNDAVEMARIFRKDDYLNDLFGIKNKDNIEYIYQAQFVVDLKCSDGQTVKFKIMPDLLKVDHNKKTVQPVDLKTSLMPAYDFKESFLKFRYDIEAACYTDVLRIIMDNDEVYREYTILPYLFTDISRTDKVPVTYVYDPCSQSQINGFTYTINDKTYTHKHWTVLLSEILQIEQDNAKVPEWIKTDGPNDILSVINK